MSEWEWSYVYDLIPKTSFLFFPREIQGGLKGWGIFHQEWDMNWILNIFLLRQTYSKVLLIQFLLAENKFTFWILAEHRWGNISHLIQENSFLAAADSFWSLWTQELWPHLSPVILLVFFCRHIKPTTTYCNLPLFGVDRYIPLSTPFWPCLHSQTVLQMISPVSDLFYSSAFWLGCLPAWLSQGTASEFSR